MPRHFIGIDVGTGSARAGIFDGTGRMLATAKRDIALYRDGPDIAEQSSANIWQAVCASVREAMANAKLAADDIAGIGFDGQGAATGVSAHPFDSDRAAAGAHVPQQLPRQRRQTGQGNGPYIAFGQLAVMAERAVGQPAAS